MHAKLQDSDGHVGQLWPRERRRRLSLRSGHDNSGANAPLSVPGSAEVVAIKESDQDQRALVRREPVWLETLLRLVFEVGKLLPDWRRDLTSGDK